MKRTFVSYAEKMAKEEKEGEGGRAAAVFIHIWLLIIESSLQLSS